MAMFSGLTWPINLRLGAAAAAIAISLTMTPAIAQNESGLSQDEENALIDDISAYLNAVETISGEFVQIEPGGVITEGDYAIRRPGRMFFSYDPPNAVRVVADGFWVAVFDEVEDPDVDRYFLSELPLSMFLDDDVDLRRDNAVARVEVANDFYRIALVDPEGDIDGEIVLVLDREPLRLREWTVVGGDGYTTRVVLRTAEFNIRVDPALFVIDGFDDDDDRRND